MAIVFIDGFDSYSTITDVCRKWRHCNLGSKSKLKIGRTGAGQSLHIFGDNNRTAYIGIKDVGNKPTWNVGFAFMNVNMEGHFTLLNFNDGADTQLSLEFTPEVGQFTVWSDGEKLGTAPSVLLDGVWHYVEIRVEISNSGSVLLRIDGDDEIDLTGVPLDVSGNSYANSVMFRRPSKWDKGYAIDDVYILDGTGTSNNNLLGDMQVITLVPEAAGDSTEWTASSGDNWSAVLGDNNRYVLSDYYGDKDLYNFSDMTGTSINNIAGVVVNVYPKSTDGSTKYINAVAKSGTTEANATHQAFTSTDYVGLQYVFETDPDTDEAWTVSGVNAAQFGITLYPDLLIGMLAFYPMDDDTNDTSGNTRHLTGTTTFDAGLIDSAMMTATVTNTAFSTGKDWSSTPWSVSAWFQQPVSPGTSGGYVTFECDSSDVFTLSVSSTEAAVVLGTGDAPVTGTISAGWNHLALVYDGSDAEFFINGSSAGAVTGTLPTSTAATSLVVAAENDYATPVDMVGIWEIDLNQYKIDTLYNTGDGFDPTL